MGSDTEYKGNDVFEDVMAAMQNAEEAGGPEGQHYVDLMLRVASEATKRADAYRATLGAIMRPMCPGCTSTAVDDFEIRESYSAYHPIDRIVEGRVFVRNALATTCPSEHFDDGKGDFVAMCRSCLHVGSTESFGLGDNGEWEWE